MRNFSLSVANLLHFAEKANFLPKKQIKIVEMLGNVGFRGVLALSRQPLKSAEICTAVEINLHCGAAIGVLWCK